MLLEIVQIGDPVLREKCSDVEEISEEIVALAENMLETMYQAHGVGLAAPQIGRALRMAVIDVSHDPQCVSFMTLNDEEVNMCDHMPLVIINPVLELDGPRAIETEGCLSIRGVRAPVGRPSIVKARFLQLDGSEVVVETDGLLARAFQHEIDHLDGVLFLDRLSPAAKMGIRKQLRALGV
ncbi:MAG: peptide deformylase [Verrucomicrobiota bacterium]|jgi:peptide deformylase